MKMARIETTNQKHSLLSGKIRALEIKMEDYYSQHKKLKKEANRLGKYIEERISKISHLDCLRTT